MEKEINVFEKTTSLPKKEKNPIFQVPLVTQFKTKVIQRLEDAFAEFDENDEAVPVQYIFPKIELPPIPSLEEIEKCLLQNALLLVDAGEYSLCRSILGEILRKNSKSPEPLRWMGWCFKQEGQFEEAQKCYEQLIKLRSHGLDYFELGEIYYILEKDPQAISTWLEALMHCDAESAYLFDLHKGLGNAYTRTGDYDSAEENYNKALVLRSRSDALQVNLGTLAFQRENYLQAMSYFKHALEINSFNDRAWTGVAMVAKQMKDNDWARAMLLKALDINPANLVAADLLNQWIGQNGS